MMVSMVIAQSRCLHNKIRGRLPSQCLTACESEQQTLLSPYLTVVLGPQASRVTETLMSKRIHGCVMLISKDKLLIV